MKHKYHIKGIDRKAIKKEGMKPLPLSIMKASENLLQYVDKLKISPSSMEFFNMVGKNKCKPNQSSIQP